MRAENRPEKAEVLFLWFSSDLEYVFCKDCFYIFRVLPWLYELCKHYCCLVCKQKVSSVFIVSCQWKYLVLHYNQEFDCQIWFVSAVTGISISEWSCAKPNWLNEMFYHFMHQSWNCNVKQNRITLFSSLWHSSSVLSITWSILIVSVIMIRLWLFSVLATSCMSRDCQLVPLLVSLRAEPAPAAALI